MGAPAPHRVNAAGGARARMMIDLAVDPPFTKRLADISAEGYWVHNARMKAVTGEFVRDPLNQALITAPLYTVVTYGVFRALGVSLATARLTSAVAGLIVLVAGALIIARATGDLAWAAPSWSASA